MSSGTEERKRGLGEGGGGYAARFDIGERQFNGLLQGILLVGSRVFVYPEHQIICVKGAAEIWHRENLFR